MSASVVVLTTSKTRSWIPQPKSGRITRSSFLVDRMIQIDCCTSFSYSTSWMEASFSCSRTGNAHPRPRKLFACGKVFSPSTDQHREFADQNRVRRGLDDRVSLAHRGQAVDQHRGTARGDDPPDVRRWAIEQRPGVEVRGCPPGRLPTDEHVDAPR